MASLRRSEFFANLPPPAECLAILVGCAEVFAFGLAGLANPHEFSVGLGLPIDAPDVPASSTGDGTATFKDAQSQELTANQRTQHALTQAIAARNLSHGALILTLALYVKDRRALGYAIGAGVVTTLADYFIVAAYGVRKGAAIHAMGALNTVLLGASLLYWGRDDPFFSRK